MRRCVHFCAIVSQANVRHFWGKYVRDRATEVLAELIVRKLLFLSMLVAVGCGGEDTDPGIESPNGGKEDGFEQSEVPSTFEEFKASLYCEPDGGPCIVQGDVPIWGDEALEAYYVSRLGLITGLTVMSNNAVDATWDPTERHALNYCVSDLFGDRKQEVLSAMQEATVQWQQIADVTFVYRPEQDARCNNRNAQVVFNVTPTSDIFARYIARAFFPSNKERQRREVLVNFTAHDNMTSDTSLAGDYSLTGVLRHELGHVLGFRHEHIRDEAQAYFCKEDENYRPITTYDAKSVMHYPQCNGAGDWGLALSDMDARGAAFFYPDFSDYQASRCAEEVDAEGLVLATCEPVVHQMLELANTGSEDVLDNWVKLDRRAVTTILEQRKTRPFHSLQELYDVLYIGPVSVRKMYDYLYVNGRCPVEMDDNGLVNALCMPVVHRVLELANTAPQETLDVEVGLDSRAAANIAAIRVHRPFTSFAELWDVDYVKTTAIAKMYKHLYP